VRVGAFSSVWNLAEDESYMLGIHSCDPTLSRGDRVSDFAFNTQKSVLAASTVGGTVVMWRRTGAHVRGLCVFLYLLRCG
jgi:hypothetical protein